MGGYIPHWTPEELEAYRKRLAKAPPRKSQTKAATAPRAAEVPRKTPHAPAVNPLTLAPYDPAKSVEVPLRAATGRMSKTEERYQRDVLHGAGRFEPVSLRLPGGGRYTPDFMTIDDGQVTFHEVKGSYRLGSQGRAFTAFHDAAAYYPMWRFVWAKWTGKAWERQSAIING